MDTDKNPDPLVIEEASRAELIAEFNNLVDVLDTAENELSIAQEDVKGKKAAVATIETALRAKAREVRDGAKPLPLLDAPAD